ncbi:hypothetical protein HIM_00819 [Hirsutella minnesotensis 3608]|nr:hypothetical protein HIM_00819 [Hirsutella minnesotensis 3608]
MAASGNATSTLGRDLAGGTGAKGRTGGGEPLGSTAEGAPGPPKVSNANVPGVDLAKELTDEQKHEVEEHNRQFAKKHDRGHSAQEFRPDRKFWSGSQEK